MAIHAPSTGEGKRARTATLAAASLGFAVIQLDVFVVNVGVKQIGASLGGDPGERAKALGLSSGASVALSAGPVAGGVLIAGVGWRSIFFINVPIGAAGFCLTRRYTIELPVTARIDVRGQLAAVIAMTALASGLIEGGTAGFTSPFVIAALAIGSAALAGFFGLEARAAEPMLPLPLFRRAPFAAPALLGLVANVGWPGSTPRSSSRSGW